VESGKTIAQIPFEGKEKVIIARKVACEPQRDAQDSRFSQPCRVWMTFAKQKAIIYNDGVRLLSYFFLVAALNASL
jgi:hypothetical protein